VDGSRGAILQLLFSNHEVSRAHMSRVSGLSKQTVSTVIADLESLHLVEAVGVTEGGIGRRALTYRLSPKAGYSVGIDLGGTNFRAGVVDFSGEVLSELTLVTPHASVDELLEIMVSAIDQLTLKHGMPKSQLSQIVIGIPGAVNPITGVISSAPNVAYLNGLNLGRLISKKLKVSVLIENDVNIAALGELEQSTSNDFGFLAIGTGVGMGLILDGELRRGFSGGAGEVGYLPLGHKALEPSVEGHFEKMVGGFAGEIKYHELSGSKVSLEEIFDLSNHGDQIAKKIIEDLAIYIALGIKTVCSILDLEEIVLGGGIGSRPDLEKQILCNLQRLMPTPPKVRISNLGSRAGLIGAMSCALSEMRSRVLVHGSLKGNSDV